MKSCAYCGGENEDHALHCRQCGTEFATPLSAMASPRQNDDAEAELPEPECDVPPNGEAALCTYCLFPNLPETPWCKRCGASVSFASIVGPVDAARASGFMWRGALRGRPKPFVLASVWLLFFPRLLWDLLVALSILTSGFSDPLDLPMFWLALAFAAVAFTMLYQVTRNYVTIPPMHWNESAA